MSILFATLILATFSWTFGPIKAEVPTVAKSANSPFDEHFIKTTLMVFRTEIIPQKTEQILEQLRKNCQRVMRKKFEKCLQRFDQDSRSAMANVADTAAIAGADTAAIAGADLRWPTCCVIYRYHKCIRKALVINSYYSISLCNTQDVNLAESVLNQVDHSSTANGFCPANKQHIEYSLCDNEINGRFFGNNLLTNMVLVMGGIALTMLVMLTIYIFHRNHRIWGSRQGNRPAFQLLEPQEMVATNHYCGHFSKNVANKP